MNRLPETPWERTKRKFTNEPLVPLGAFLTACCLGAGLKSFKDGNSIKGQKFMRGRVVLQAFTVMIMSLGSVYGFKSKDSPSAIQIPVSPITEVK